MTDAWRPFEPCRENVREARVREGSLAGRLIARELEFFRPNPYAVQYPRLKSARLIPFTLAPYSDGFYFKRPHIAFRVAKTDPCAHCGRACAPPCCCQPDNPHKACPTSRGRYTCWNGCSCKFVNHDRGDEDRS